MNITSYTREQITEGLNRARDANRGAGSDHIRVLFSPITIDDQNFDRACDIYSRIDPDNYETVVVVETYGEDLDKRLPMPSNRFFKTPLGQVKANEFMRDEFCDEDDDFFIHDEGYSEDMSLFQQLMMLQCTFGDDFSVLSVQVADQGPAIVKELAWVLEEVLASRRALVVFCCELDNERTEEFEKVRRMIASNNQSGLLNYLNSGESHIRGTSSFIAGVLVAHAWKLDITFLNGEYSNNRGSLVTAYGDRQNVFIRP
ncbi:MAG: AmmeMemoRadiSam system protein B [Balneolaceae bacterium]|nr:AmmeMemoRadiSam system protein B [Balneolaceae bacterium]